MVRRCVLSRHLRGSVWLTHWMNVTKVEAREVTKGQIDQTAFLQGWTHLYSPPAVCAMPALQSFTSAEYHGYFTLLLML